jgi:hypothetical protein
VLFSQAETAAWIDGRFEAAWRSLHPVPLVTVDFGDRRTVTRTLHGNVVTWICTPDGEIVDGLPGLYDASTYRARLEEIAALADRIRTLPAAERRAAVADHHRGRSDREARARAPAMSKRAIERPLERAFRNPPAPPAALLAPAAALAADTRLNEAEARPALHTLLLDSGPSRPADVERKVYREILHVDLDDPWLGLAPALFDPGDPRRDARRETSVADGAPALQGLSQRGR